MCNKTMNNSNSAANLINTRDPYDKRFSLPAELLEYQTKGFHNRKKMGVYYNQRSGMRNIH